MQSKDVCLRILAQESEAGVSHIVEEVPDLADPANWFPIDGRETNFNVVTNQASTGSKALTELCTNMVDAVLMKYAYQAGVDPTGPNAPQTVIEGVRTLVKLPGVHSGILAEADDERYLKEFAEKNLVIGVTGGTRREESLCFTFVDSGEGQHPENFEDTFLSLSSGNKSAIPFVQGKYNMGSSGVLTYCGTRWYKLVVSRRYDGNGLWGWTLIRRRPGDGPPIAEYFMYQSAIPFFEASTLYPLQLGSGGPDEFVGIATGTIVKLYDYQMESAASFRSIRESLNENLVSTVLPMRLMDYRQQPSQRRTGRRALGIDERGVNGMEYLLLKRAPDEEDADEEGGEVEVSREQHIGDINDPRLGQVSIRAIILGRTLPGWLRTSRNNNRVYHAVNGQVQFKDTRGYLSGRCKLPALKDRVVLIVDASNLTEAAHNDVWKGDRERIRASKIGQIYYDRITEAIASSQILQDLQHQIAREEAEGITSRSQVELLKRLIDNDPSIAQLLPGGTLVKFSGSTLRQRPDDNWDGKYSPTFLRVQGRSVREQGAEITVDGKRRVTFETDVVNNYLIRPENRGRVFTTGMGTRFSYDPILRDGQMTITFTALPDQVQAGEIVKVSVGLIDDAIPEPVLADLTLKVVDERRRSPSGKRNPQPDTEERAGPERTWLTKDGRMIGSETSEPWPLGFTEQDGGEVTDLGELKKFGINYDNAHFRRMLEKENDDIKRKVITEQYRMGMLILMLGLEDAYSRMEQGEEKEAIEEHIEVIRRLAAKGSSTVVMSIAKTLPDLINPAFVAEQVDD